MGESIERENDERDQKVVMVMLANFFGQKDTQIECGALQKARKLKCAKGVDDKSEKNEIKFGIKWD